MKLKEKNNDTLVIICSTPNSRRIPEKCFLKIAGKTVLEHILDRIKPLNIPTVLAVPLSTSEIKRAKYHSCIIDNNAEMFYGNTESPLHRMKEVLQTRGKYYKYVIRITHDDILIDAKTITLLLNKVKKYEASYGYTPEIIEGAGVEIILTDTIIKQAERITQPVEHISYFVKGNKPISVKPRKEICREYRLTLDYPEDATLLETVLRILGADADCEMICAFLDENKLLLKYNELPDITIYTCMYNAEKWICECINSVLISAKASNLKFEYILIDDCSRDYSLVQALQQLGLWAIKNFKIVANKKNIGLASSSNIALSIAKGKYIMRVDADDRLSAYAVKNLIEKIIEDDAVIVYPDYYEYRQGSPEGHAMPIVRGYVNHHVGCAIMNKKTINELKFTEKLRHWDSLDLHEKIKSHKNLKISYLEKPQFMYRKHRRSLSANNTKERIDTLEKIVRKYGVKRKK